MMERLINRGKSSGRVDDNPETIKKRLQVFHANTDPILKHLKAKLATIEANKSVEDVFAEVEKAVAKVLH